MILKILWPWSLVCTIGAMSWWWDHPVALDDELLSIGNLSVRRRPLLSKPPTTMAPLHSSWNWRDKYADKRAGGERQKSRSGANPRPIRVNFCHSAAEVMWSEGQKEGAKNRSILSRCEKEIEQRHRKRDGSSLCWLSAQVGRELLLFRLSQIFETELFASLCQFSREKEEFFFNSSF